MAGCIFCGASPITNAHIFRKAWIDEVTPRARGFRHRRGPRAQVPGPGQREWIKDAIDLKVKAACNDCNSGWMERLDLAAEEAFLTHAVLGFDVKLALMSERTTLARWCALITVLLDQTLRPPTVPRRHHMSLYDGEIPEGFQAWIFRTQPPEDRDVVWTGSRHLTLTGRMRRSGVLHTNDFYFGTFGVLQFVCHAALPTEATATGVKLFRRPTGEAREVAPPPLTPLIWPPPETLSWEDALELPDQMQREVESRAE